MAEGLRHAALLGAAAPSVVSHGKTQTSESSLPGVTTDARAFYTTPKGLASDLLAGKGLSQSPRSAFAIAHTRPFPVTTFRLRDCPYSSFPKGRLLPLTVHVIHITTD
jgi:hypothetical protein